MLGVENYDEDLNDNSFFQTLQNDHADLFLRVIEEGWIICVPRAGSLPRYAFTHEDFFSHILIPSDELPESHFRTLNDKEVRICNRVITVETDEASQAAFSTHILFEETFYTEDLLKYKVVCVENPLGGLTENGQSLDIGIVNLATLRDCIDLLWTESSSGGQQVLEKIDELVLSFIKTHSSIDSETLQVQRDLVGALYTQALQAAVRDPRLREKTTVDRHLLQNVKVAVETYVLHGVYKTVISGITACTAYEDAHLNKIIRNLADIQLRDLDVRPDLYDTIPRAKQELARIDGFGTVLGKLGCIKRSVTTVSRQQVGTMSEHCGTVIAADDLLPVMIFITIKAGIPNWVANLHFMKQFRFSSTSSEADEYCFLLTSLEAAIEHIRSGNLLGVSSWYPEAQQDFEHDEGLQADFGNLSLTRQLNGTSFKNTSETISSFFKLVAKGKIDEVCNVLKKASEVSKDSEVANTVVDLCHPLCSCDKCERSLSKIRCKTAPTILTCDDRGLTALHVASLFGRPKMVDLLLGYGADVNATDFRGSTPLHYAAMRGHQNALLLLVHTKADINAVDNDGNTPLHFASLNGHECCVKALVYFAEHVGKYLNVSACNSHGDTPLHHASHWGYEGIVQILLEYGAQADIRNKRKQTPLACAHSIHVLRLLSNSPKSKVSGNLEESVKDESDAGFHQSDLLTSEYVVVDELCEDNVNEVSLSFSNSLDFTESLNVENSNLKRDMTFPTSSGEMKNVEKLLKAIAVDDIQLACFYLGLEDLSVNNMSQSNTYDLSLSSLKDMQPLCHPLCTCEKCQPLIEDVDAWRDRTQQNSISDGQMLTINVCNAEGFTPLHVAALYGRINMVKMLLRYSARVNVRNWLRGATPLHLACQNNQIEVVRLLLDDGCCDVNARDKYGNTPLHYCCMAGAVELIEILIKFNANSNIKNISGKSPIEIAEEKMYLRIIQILKGESILPP